MAVWSPNLKQLTGFPEKDTIVHRTNSKQFLPEVWHFLNTVRVIRSHNAAGSYQVSLCYVFT